LCILDKAVLVYEKNDWTLARSTEIDGFHPKGGPLGRHVAIRPSDFPVDESNIRNAVCRDRQKNL
jgi:hypothetical protein